MTRSVATGIAVLSLVVAALVVLGYRSAAASLDAPAEVRRRWTTVAAVIAVVWLALTGAIAASGILLRFDQSPPPIMFLVAAVLAGGTAIGLSRVGERLATGLPLATLVGFHGFRLPLELVLRQGYEAGLTPLQMTFSGWNFDIVTGVSALVLAAVLARRTVPLWIVALWNAVGSFLLLVVSVIGVASTPMFRAFGGDPGQLNTWIARFPYVWLPSVLVMAALAGHIVVARRLLRDARGPAGEDRPGARLN